MLFAWLLVWYMVSLQGFNEVLDTSFGNPATPGFTTALLLSSPNNSILSGTSPFAILLDGDKPLLGLSTNQRNAVARYSNSGFLDKTFNSNGSVPGVTEQILINANASTSFPRITNGLQLPQLFIVTTTTGKRYRSLGSITDFSGTGWTGGIQWLTSGILDTAFTNSAVATIAGTTLMNLPNTPYASGTVMQSSIVRGTDNLFAGTNLPSTGNTPQAVVGDMTITGIANSAFGTAGSTGYSLITQGSDQLYGINICLTTTNKPCLLGFDGTQQKFFVTRLQSNGALDSFFGNNGTTLLPTTQQKSMQIGTINTRFTNLIIPLTVNPLLDPTLLIVAQQNLITGGNTANVTLLAELTANGRLATAFTPINNSVSAIVTPGIGTFAIPGAASTTVQQVLTVSSGLIGSLPDIILVGIAVSNVVSFPFLYKFSGTTGKPISSFGNNGLVLLNSIGIGNFVTQQSELAAAILQPNGSIVVGGSAFINASAYAFVARVTATGQLDTTFNTKTIERTWLRLIQYPNSFTRMPAMIQQPDGKFLLALQIFSRQTTVPTSIAQTVIARLTA